MSSEEYVQLKAFARQDGALLSLLWIGALICYIQGLASPLLGMVSMVLIVLSPFFVARRLSHFRDYGREGVISFTRGYVYTIFTYFYSGLLLAVALYVYFAFIDHGYLLGKFTEILHSAEGRAVMKMYGMGDQMDDALHELQGMRPIDYAVNILSITILTGMLLGLPIAALMQRRVANGNSNS